MILPSRPCFPMWGSLTDYLSVSSQLTMLLTFYPFSTSSLFAALIFLVDMIWKFQIALSSPAVFPTLSLSFLFFCGFFGFFIPLQSFFHKLNWLPSPVLSCLRSLFVDIVGLVLMDHPQVSAPCFLILLHHNHCLSCSLSFPLSLLPWKYLFFIRPSLEIVPHPSFPLSISLSALER